MTKAGLGLETGPMEVCVPKKTSQSESILGLGNAAHSGVLALGSQPRCVHSQPIGVKSGRWAGWQRTP